LDAHTFLTFSTFTLELALHPHNIRPPPPEHPLAIEPGAHIDHPMLAPFKVGFYRIPSIERSVCGEISSTKRLKIPSGRAHAKRVYIDRICTEFPLIRHGKCVFIHRFLPSLMIFSEVIQHARLYAVELEKVGISKTRVPQNVFVR
jgi:hypothetical protein